VKQKLKAVLWVIGIVLTLLGIFSLYQSMGSEIGWDSPKPYMPQRRIEFEVGIEYGGLKFRQLDWRHEPHLGAMPHGGPGNGGSFSLGMADTYPFEDSYTDWATPTIDFKSERIGFQLYAITLKHEHFSEHVRSLTFPLWPIVVLTSFFSLCRFRRWRIYKERKRMGWCLVCGYDLRASNKSCPECGTPVS
jgi:hypothetical protein